MSRHAEWARRYGTPLYVYDLDRVRAARRDLRASLPEECALFYSLKANPHPDVARSLREGDGPPCRAELSSTGELAAALAAGYDPARALYTGPGKTRAELADAVRAGVRAFSAESVGDLRRIGAVATAHGVVADCLLRVNSAAGHAATGIRMTGAPSQFGFDSEVIPDLVDELTSVPGTRVTGMHLFPLSNARDEASLIGEFQHSLATAARLRDRTGLPLRLLDIGGGFAAPYAVPGARPVYDKLRVELSAALDLHFPHWRAGDPEVACESGRYLVGDSGELLCSVVDVKVSRGRRFLVLDAGINALGGMAGLGRLMPLVARPDRDDVAQVASLVGPLCTPGDVLAREVGLPDLGVGDVVAIPNAGAYGVTASLLAFLSRPAPVELVVRGGRVVSASRLRHDRVPVGPSAD